MSRERGVKDEHAKGAGALGRWREGRLASGRLRALDRPSNMRRALVLSGGGAKGVWQVGACEHLIAERGYWFDVISGVSAGAVNAAALAPAADAHGLERELEHLRSVWLGLRGDCDIYRRRPFGALGMVLGR